MQQRGKNRRKGQAALSSNAKGGFPPWKSALSDRRMNPSQSCADRMPSCLKRRALAVRKRHNPSGSKSALRSPTIPARPPMLGGMTRSPAYPIVAITVVARCGSISLRSPIRLSSRGHMGATPSPVTAYPARHSNGQGKTAPETCPPSPSDHPAAIQRNRQSGRADGPIVKTWL